MCVLLFVHRASVSSILTSLVINGVIFLIVLFLFCYFRRRHPMVYAPRLHYFKQYVPANDGLQHLVCRARIAARSQHWKRQICVTYVAATVRHRCPTASCHGFRTSSSSPATTRC